MIEIVATVVTIVVGVAGLLYQVFKDSLSPMNRIKQTAETLAALKALTAADLKYEPRWNRRQWFMVKLNLQEKLVRDVNKMGNRKNLWATGVGFGVTALGFGYCVWRAVAYAEKNRELVDGHVLVFGGPLVLFMLSGSLSLALSVTFWRRMRALKQKTDVGEIREKAARMRRKRALRAVDAMQPNLARGSFGRGRLVESGDSIPKTTQQSRTKDVPWAKGENTSGE